MNKIKYPSYITSLNSYNGEIMLGLNNGSIHTEKFSFTAHKKEFDTLESTDITEKVNDFFMVDSGSFHYQFISCNDKSINVNKVRENVCASDIILQNFNKNELTYKSDCVKHIKNAHSYNIESLSHCQDYFISTDYLRINMWNLHNLSHSYNILDCKPNKFEEMDYIITKGSLHKNLFSYSTSNGEVFLNDLRCKNTNQLRIELPKNNDLYEEILRMVHDYTIIDNKLVVRDMNTVSFFDLRSNNLVKSVLLMTYSKEYLEDQFTSNTFGNYKLTNDGVNFFTGGKDGLVYKIDDQFNLFTNDLCIKEEIELVCVSKGMLYFTVHEYLCNINIDTFI